MNDTRQSRQRLARLIESAVRTECNFPRPGLWFAVERVTIAGWPPDQILTYAMLRFTHSGAPFCCFEPDCHLALFDDRVRRISDAVRRKLKLHQDVAVQFAHIDVSFDAGVGSRVDLPGYRPVRYRCACCGYMTLVEFAMYEVCEICGWEDDPDLTDPNRESVLNGISLLNASQNFRDFGAARAELVGQCRAPTSADQWRPAHSDCD